MINEKMRGKNNIVITEKLDDMGERSKTDKK